MCLFANTSSIWAVRFESAKIFFGKYLCSNMSVSSGCGAGGGVEVMSQGNFVSGLLQIAHAKKLFTINPRSLSIPLCSTVNSSVF